MDEIKAQIKNKGFKKMKIEYKIGLNPHATEANEYMIIAFNPDYFNYSYVSFFDLLDRDIAIEWADWGSLDCEECSEHFIENFNSSINDREAKLLVEQFIDERTQETKKLAKLRAHRVKL